MRLEARIASHSSRFVRIPVMSTGSAVSTATATQCSAIGLASTRSWRPSSSPPEAKSRIRLTSITGRPRRIRAGLTNERDASGPW